MIGMFTILIFIIFSVVAAMPQIPIPRISPVPSGPGSRGPGPGAPGSGGPPQGFPGQIVKSIEECKKEYNMDQSVLWDELEGPQKCFFQCVGQKEGLVDEDGAILKEVFIQRIQQRVMADPVLSGAIIKCLDETREDSCATVQAVAICIRASVRRFRKPLPGVPNIPSIGKKKNDLVK